LLDFGELLVAALNLGLNVRLDVVLFFRLASLVSDELGFVLQVEPLLSGHLCLALSLLLVGASLRGEPAVNVRLMQRLQVFGVNLGAALDLKRAQRVALWSRD